MIVLTPDEMRKMDKQTIKDGYPEILLMEMAGRGTAEIIDQKTKNNHKDVVIFCGTGNNGGDGFTAARFLDMWGYDVKIIFTGNKQKLSEVSKTNYNICKLRNINIEKVENLNKNEVKSTIKNTDIVVDALLGTGIRGEVRGNYTWIIDSINDNSNIVFSVDIPSGIDGYNAKVLGRAVKADFTTTMAFHKTGLILYPGKKYCGQIEVIDLGMVSSSLEKISYNHFLLTKEEAVELIPERNIEGHKGTFGKIAVIGGSRGMSGAPVLTANAALKSGAGLLKVVIPESIDKDAANYNPELITEILQAKDRGFSKKAVDDIIKIANDYDVLAVGPGLGRSSDIEKIIERIIINTNNPLVIDADGINAIKDLQLLKERTSPIIMTPHPGEMARLLNTSIEKIEENRINVACKFAQEHEVYIILKGAATIIALPDGKVYINQSGNDGLATAGSGDVLTGIIVSLLAQGTSAKTAAILAPYLHGKAGEKASQDLTSYSVCAGDIIDYIPIVLKDLFQ